MKLFQRNAKERKVNPAFVKLLVGINRRLRKFADSLQRRSAHYSIRTQKIALLAFCLVFISISVCVAIESIRSKSATTYAVRGIKVIPLAEEKVIQPKVSIEELSKIHRFKVYLDGLSKKARDSLLINRPRLTDTINFLETLYQNQIKSK